jgi:hypothetical protein
VNPGYFRFVIAAYRIRHVASSAFRTAMWADKASRKSWNGWATLDVRCALGLEF